MKAIILAAGTGSRFGTSLPKQYCLLGGRPVVMHTIDAFRKVLPPEDILLVISGEMSKYWEDLCREYSFASPAVCFGGKSRLESVANALRALGNTHDDEVVMVHDGARPLVTAQLIERMGVIPEGNVGAVPAVPVTDSLRERTADGLTRAVDRSRFLAVQTPQTFAYGLLAEAYRELANSSEASALTDDASVVETYTGRCVATIPGDPSNIKITNPIDLAVAEAILAAHV